MSDANGAPEPDEQEKKPSSRLPVAVPDRKLTIEASRLAGSPLCLNCGTALKGPFCHYCGQPDKNLMRFFPALLREMLEDFVDFDSRFMRTIKPLLFRPGKLTRDYLDGLRFRYVPPLRLYIFSSLVLFFLVAMFAVDTIQFASDVDGEERGVRVQLDDTERQELVWEAYDSIAPQGETVLDGPDLLHLDLGHGVALPHDVEVGMGPAADAAAGPAGVTGARLPGLAEQRPRDDEGHAPLADAPRSGEQVGAQLVHRLAGLAAPLGDVAGEAAEAFAFDPLALGVGQIRDHVAICIG